MVWCFSAFVLDRANANCVLIASAQVARSEDLPFAAGRAGKRGNGDKCGGSSAARLDELATAAAWQTVVKALEAPYNVRSNFVGGLGV